MDQMRAVICFPDGDASSGSETRPLMLETVLFCPVLEWMGQKLKAEGVRRFFVVCGPKFAEDARRCFAPEDDVTVSDQIPALREFLEGAGRAAVLPCAMLPLELEGGENPACLTDAGTLRAGWHDSCGGAVPGGETLPGWTAVRDLACLQRVELRCRDRIVQAHAEAGVRFLDSSAVYIDPRVKIGRGTVVLPGTILRGKTVIGGDCEIGPNTMIRECTVGSGTTVNASQLNESTVGSRTNVGPFAYVRPNSHIGDDIKVGDFVEIKNSTIGSGTKISHLTYVGDSDVGEHVNFGCGTVTTNYDGFKKYRCTIGDRAFIGCNTNLIAPVKIGAGAYTAAGSTVTRDVPDDALAIARERETVKEGWAARRRALHEPKK
ncbi:MAG: glucosamine-1-phosphate N-acetyltransferase [Oscillibacter sp.]|jgi:bifunctional UDP-N-acetylglucosamine pyrophosphorylase/glucosamine-1-phosphate N-acetyltransferase|nr:glucosamine-1-phosphate N-acetyltransferase [Oscillibacter sp.]